MGCENTRPNSISILVVDDDTTCLSFVAALLKKFKYEVVTAKHPSDALCALRIKGGAFDLVVSDINMPDMNGFELLEAITHEFNLPVVLMSVDSNSRGLKSGAAFFISKPVSPNDLKDLWQFATNSMRKKRQIVTEEENNYYYSQNKVNNNNNNKEIINPKKKPKVKWTNGLQCRFLEAIRSIGLERSVPKKILEEMNVPGLTRENVASHLQKYRMFLKKVSNASYKVEDGGGDEEGGLITRNYSVQTLNTSLNYRPQFPNFPPSSSFSSSSSSSSSFQNSLLDDEPFISTNASFHNSDNNASIQIGNSGINFPSNHEVENKINQNLSMEDYNFNESSSTLPFSSSVYDELLPSFDDDVITTSTQLQSFNPNHQLITIQNQSQMQGWMESVQFGNASSGFDKPPESTNHDGNGDALDSLLAFGLFGEDQIQSLEGI